MPLGDLEAKFSAFGWNVVTVDGHDVEALYHAIVRTEEETDRPSVVIMNTVKGKGAAFVEREKYNHHLAVSKEEAEDEQVAYLDADLMNSFETGCGGRICKKMLCCGNLRKFQYTRGHFWGRGRMPGCQSHGSRKLKDFIT